MPFNVKDFASNISKSGIAYTSHFEGLILGGPGSYSRTGAVSNILTTFGLEQGMRFRIESLNMPGRTLQTIDQQYHGPVRAMPYRFQQQPVTMTVILSKDMREREIFMRWQDFFVGHYRTNYDRAVVRGPFDTKYYQDGIGTIKIVQYSYPVSNASTSGGNQSSADGGGKYEPHTEIILEEAYPISVNDIQLAWGDEGYGKLQVEIRYHRTTEFNKTFPNRSFFDRDKANRSLM
jgi:hypothetical protein